MTDQQKQEIKKLRRLGCSYGEIANILGLSKNTIKSFCQRKGLNANKDHDKENSNLCRNCAALLIQHPGKRHKVFCNDKCRWTWWNRNRALKKMKKTGSNRARTHDKNTDKDKEHCSRDSYIESRYGEGLP